PLLVRGRMVKNLAGRRAGQPEIIGDLLLQLTLAPAGISQGDQFLLGTLVTRQGGENIPGRGQADLLGNRQRGLPAAPGAMEDEAAVGLDRTAGINELVLLQRA